MNSVVNMQDREMMNESVSETVSASVSHLDDTQNHANEHAGVPNPAMANLARRWKTAVIKASVQTEAEVAPMPFNVEHTSALLTNADHSAKFNGVKTATSAVWRALRPSQLRRVDRRLAQMQQALLAPPVCGQFELNGEIIKWQLSLPKLIANSIVAKLGALPMMVEESVELPPDEVLASENAAQAAAFELSVSAESFLFNWIAAPWSTLGADAKHALLLVALSPLAASLGLTLGEHWHVVGLGEPKDDRQASDAQMSIGISFRRAGILHTDTATICVPMVWFEKVLQSRGETTRVISIKNLLAAHPHLGSMQHKLPVIVGELMLDAASVRGLERGDVIFFATHYGSLADLWRSGEIKARIDAPWVRLDLTLDSAAQTASIRKLLPRPSDSQFKHSGGSDLVNTPHLLSSHERQKANMENTLSSIATPDDAVIAGASMSGHLAQLPIAVTIEVAELSLPLSALADIAIGTTLALAKPLNEHLLTIRANGHAIAFGELVMLDSEVGVRVKRLASTEPPMMNIDEIAAGSASVPSAPAAENAAHEHELDSLSLPA